MGRYSTPSSKACSINLRSQAAIVLHALALHPPCATHLQAETRRRHRPGAPPRHGAGTPPSPEEGAEQTQAALAPPPPPLPLAERRRRRQRGALAGARGAAAAGWARGSGVGAGAGAALPAPAAPPVLAHAASLLQVPLLPLALGLQERGRRRLVQRLLPVPERLLQLPAQHQQRAAERGHHKETGNESILLKGSIACVQRGAQAVERGARLQGVTQKKCALHHRPPQP